MKRIFGVLLCGVLLLPALPAAAQPYRGEPFSCSLDGVSNSLTVCMAAKGEQRFWITKIVAQSTTTTAGQFILRYGTGTACGTGTASLFPAAATAARWGYPASTSAPTVIDLSESPIAAPKEVDLCVLAVATNTLTISIHGYLAP